MIPEVKKEIIDLGDGRTISIETGKLANKPMAQWLFAWGMPCF